MSTAQKTGWVLAFALVAVLALGRAQPAGAGTQTLTFQSQEITVAGHGVATAFTRVDSPMLDGYVVGMTADVVDAAGKVQGDREIMLHHIVFIRWGEADYTCPGGQIQRFYAPGEERATLSLPPGFGLAHRAGATWGISYMLMNHFPKKLRGFIRYQVRYVTGEELIPVTPVWLSINRCIDPNFDVPGTGPKRSTYTKTEDFVMRDSGAFVGVGGHIHGGGIRVELRNVTCGTKPFTSLPTWSKHVPLKPVLHEPGPAKMSSFVSADGIPVAAGERLRIAAVYDNDRPHTRAMGGMILYFARRPVGSCAPTPPLEVDLGQPSLPPPFSMPLPRKPRGPLHRNIGGTWVGDYRFGHERLSLARGANFAWRFIGAVDHDVTLVSGPVGFSSPTTRRGTFRYRFTRPGTYSLMCSLHPTQMAQSIAVRR